MPRPHGYSLVELAVVVTLLAMGVVLAVPSFTGLLDAQRVVAANNRLVAEIQQARLGAVASGQRVVICGSVDGTTCAGRSDWSGGTLRFEDVDRDSRRDPDESVTGIIPASDLQGLRVGSTAGRRSLGFNPDGLTAGANQTVYICSVRGPEWRRIVINFAGRPRTARPEKGKSCPL